MRYLICVFIGLLIGAITATTAANVLSHRHAYPKALMRVMQHELGVAAEFADKQTCAEAAPALRKLSLLADDIENAMFTSEPPDRVFRQYADDLRNKIALASVSTCPNQAQAMTDLDNACDACHRDYR